MPPQLIGNWRDFRARLIQTSASEASSTSSSVVSDDDMAVGSSSSAMPGSGRPTTTAGGGGGSGGGRFSKLNLAKLQREDPELAAEGVWCHELPGGPERGGIIISTRSSSSSSDGLGMTASERQMSGRKEVVAKLEEVVALLIEHGTQGSIALILNRPTALLLGKGGPRGMPMDLVGAPSIVQAVFRDSRLYCGGFTAQHVIHMIHGQAQLAKGGAHEIVPGIFMGGELAAAAEVEAGRMRAGSFRFFAGALVFEPGELQRQTEEGMWLSAACSRSLVLKQCEQLSTPLWKEVRMLMGGKYTEEAGGEDILEGESDSEEEEE